MELPPIEATTAVPHRCRDYYECYHLTQIDLATLVAVSSAGGLPQKEIARQMRIGYATFKSRLTRLNHIFATSSALALIVKAHQLQVITIPQVENPPPVILMPALTAQGMAAETYAVHRSKVI